MPKTHGSKTILKIYLHFTTTMVKVMKNYGVKLVTKQYGMTR